MTARTVGVMQTIPSRAARDAERGLAAAQIDAAEGDRAATVQTVLQRIAAASIDEWAIQQKRTVLLTLCSEIVPAGLVTQDRFRASEGNATAPLDATAESTSLVNGLDGTVADIV